MNKKQLTFGLLAVMTVLAVVTAPALAQQNTDAEYYNNSSSDADTDSWLSGLTDASLDDILTLATRIGGFLIGDATAQGGVGSAGALLTGLLVAGVMGGVGMRSGAGSTGGLVIGISAGTVFLSASLGATWAYAVILFVVGLIVAVVFLRVVR
jgi:hypothetical protein